MKHGFVLLIIFILFLEIILVLFERTVSLTHENAALSIYSVEESTFYTYMVAILKIFNILILLALHFGCIDFQKLSK